MTDDQAIELIFANTACKKFQELLTQVRPDLMFFNIGFERFSGTVQIQIRYKNSRLGEHRRFFVDFQGAEVVRVRKKMFDNDDREGSFSDRFKALKFVIKNAPIVPEVKQKLYYDL